MVGSAAMGAITSRRAFAAGLGALGSCLFAASARAAPKRLLLLGSSMMAGAFGSILEDRFGKLGYAVHRRPRSASGLSRPDFFDWFAEGERLRRDFRPTVSLVIFGANDGQGIWMGGKARAEQWIRWHEDGWRAEYARRVNRLADVLGPRGEPVIWVGAPVMRPPKLNARVQILNGIYEREMAWRPRALFVDMSAVLADRNGNYTEYVRHEGKTLQARSPDGVHVSRHGAKVMVDHIMPRAQVFLAEDRTPRPSIDERRCTEHFRGSFG